MALRVVVLVLWPFLVAWRMSWMVMVVVGVPFSVTVMV